MMLATSTSCFAPRICAMEEEESELKKAFDTNASAVSTSAYTRTSRMSESGKACLSTSTRWYDTAQSVIN